MEDINQTLYDAARSVLKNAYSPYSEIKIGVSILSQEGEIFTGVNVENSSYPEGVCAETSAISAMISAGHKKIKQVYVVCDFRGTGEIATPCGGCRQRLKEFASSDIKISMSNLDQSKVETHTMEALLPFSFSLKDTI